MFFKKHGRRHGVAGLVYLIWLLVGFVQIFVEAPYLNLILYDVVLGLLGITLTLTAAADFPHKNIKNAASGSRQAGTLVFIQFYGPRIQPFAVEADRVGPFRALAGVHGSKSALD